MLAAKPTPPCQRRPSAKSRLPSPCAGAHAHAVFIVDEETAEAIRRAWEEGGELAGVVELRRHFPLTPDDEQARRCVRAIVGWGAPRRPAPDQEQG